MKASIHLFYGIIIGVLATLCIGMTKEEQKEFKEIREVKWSGEYRPLGKLADGFYEHGRSGNQYDLVIKTAHQIPSEITKAGWTIIDFEGVGSGTYYLIGR